MLGSTVSVAVSVNNAVQALAQALYENKVTPETEYPNGIINIATLTGVHGAVQLKAMHNDSMAKLRKNQPEPERFSQISTNMGYSVVLPDLSPTVEQITQALNLIIRLVSDQGISRLRCKNNDFGVGKAGGDVLLDLDGNKLGDFFELPGLIKNVQFRPVDDGDDSGAGQVEDAPNEKPVTV